MCIVRLVLVLNLFFILLLVKHEISAQSVRYYPYEDTWLDAHKRCYDYGGRLATNEDKLNCNQIDSPKRSTYWTGKYKTISHWISKIGCYKLLRNQTVLNAQSVSRCFEVCRDQHLHINLLAHTVYGNKCVCIKENISSHHKTDKTLQCNQPLNSDNYLVYIVIRNTTLTGTGNCAFVDCQNETEMRTSNCATERTPYCDGYSFADTLNWNMSEEKCKYHIPGNIEDICQTGTIGPPGVWVPIQRVEFWAKVTSNGAAKEEIEYVTECQSFLCPNNEATQILANISCKEKTNGFFCVNSNNMTKDRTKTFMELALLFPETHSSKPQKIHGINERGQNEYKVTGTTSTIVTQNDNRNSTAISEHHATSNIGLIVGGVLGAFVLFGVVIIVVILTLRRKKASTKKRNVEQSEISNEDQKRKTPSNNIRVNQLYEDEGACADIPLPVRSKESEIANEHGRKKPNDVYAVVMKINKPSPLQVGLKSVLASADAVESEYDRMNITPTFLEDNMENNLYDSNIADRCESDPSYNTATHIRHSRQNTEDVYN